MPQLASLTKSVLRALEADADCSAVSIAQALRVRTHRVRYELNRVVSAPGSTRRILINTHALGYLRQAFFVSFRPQKTADRNALLLELVHSPWISLVLELGGDYQFEINLTTRSLSEMTSAVAWLSKLCGQSLLAKNIAIQLSHEVYGTKVFGESPVRAGTSPQIAVGETAQKIDSLDHTILSGMMSSKDVSYRELARTLRLPATTVDSRIKSLRRRNIIAGSTYSFEDFGTHHFVLLVYTRNLDPIFRKKLKQFARKHWAIHYLVENIGSWDFELGLEVLATEQITRVMQDVYASFEREVYSVKALPIIRRIKVMDYPFHEYVNNS